MADSVVAVYTPHHRHLWNIGYCVFPKNNTANIASPELCSAAAPPPKEFVVRRASMVKGELAPDRELLAAAASCRNRVTLTTDSI